MENDTSPPEVDTSNDSNLAEMRQRLETFSAQATLYAETLGQTVTEQTAEAYNAATEYAKNIEEIAANADTLTPEVCTERLGQLRAAYLSNPALGSRIMGLGDEMETNAGTMAIGVVMIITGLFLAFMGRRIFNVFLIISGFIVFSSATLLSIILVKPYISFTISPLAFWCIAIAGGCIGAVIFKKSWKFAVYCMSCYGGMLTGFWALGMVPEIKDYINKSVFIFICSSLAGVCAHYLDELIVIVSSSLAGAFTAFVGLDMIKPNGFRTSLVAVINSVDVSSAKNLASEFLIGNVRNYMIGVLFVTVSGIYVQYRHQPRSYDHE